MATGMIWAGVINRVPNRGTVGLVSDDGLGVIEEEGVREAAEPLVKSGVGRIVYVSCNPKAFKLDYERHLKAAYLFESATLIDMFPHTPHVEAAMCWKRKRDQTAFQKGSLFALTFAVILRAFISLSSSSLLSCLASRITSFLLRST